MTYDNDRVPEDHPDFDRYMTAAATDVVVEDFAATFFDGVSREDHERAQAAFDAHLETLGEEDQVTAGCHVIGHLFEMAGQDDEEL